jgi:DNA topoisomerase-1
LLESRRFKPTDVGRIVNKFLTHYFQTYVDYDFTAKLEDELDAVARGEKQWIPLLKAFWTPFIEQVQHIEGSVKRKDVTHEALDEACPKCGNPLSIRLGKRGRFIGCTTYPACDYTRSLEDDAQASVEPKIVEGRVCSDCGAPLVIKRGKYGEFIGCSKYPACKHIEPLEKPEDTAVNCPSCHKGTLIKKKSRYGTYFYACQQYPDCKYAVNHPPIAESCPQCQWPILLIKTTKRKGTEKVCPVKECSFTELLEGPASET